MTDTIRLNTKELTLKVKFPPAYGLRLRLSSALLRLAGWVAGVQTEVVESDTVQPQAISTAMIERLSLNPGDRLVVRARGHLSAEAAKQIREGLGCWAPDIPTLVLDETLQMSVVRPAHEIPDCAEVGKEPSNGL